MGVADQLRRTRAASGLDPAAAVVHRCGSRTRSPISTSPRSSAWIPQRVVRCPARGELLGHRSARPRGLVRASGTTTAAPSTARMPSPAPSRRMAGHEKGEDRYIEIWNLVFDQFLRGEGKGKDYPLLGELEQKSIDTGMGVERVAYLLQGKQNMYEIDQIFAVIEKAQELSGRVYGADGEDDVHLRIVGDHVRSALMLVGRRCAPGQRGPRLRAAPSDPPCGAVDAPARLLGAVHARSCCRSRRSLMVESYPELDADFGRISEIVYAEEEAFRRTLVTGTAIFDQVAGPREAGRRRRRPRRRCLPSARHLRIPDRSHDRDGAGGGPDVDADAFRASDVRSSANARGPMPPRRRPATPTPRSTTGC